MYRQRLTVWIKEQRQLLILAAAAVLMVVCVSAFKYRSGEINYYNSDATWHTLLTIEAYNETPVSDHLFLPIVSLGGQDNKHIAWGVTIPDKGGNYYYTSFPAAGYFFPWLFMKIFGLPVTERSLYIFNSFLYALSGGLWTWLIYKTYESSKEVVVISMTGMLTFIYSPELFHGMGIVYWHQSLMQVTLLFQIIAFYSMTQSDGRKARVAFYLLVLLNPVIEWTGYVANIGFALAELLFNWKKDRRRAAGKACKIVILTVVSGILFISHYLLRVDIQYFLETIKSRFLERSIVETAELTDVFGGYFKSFLYLWVLFLILIIWSFIQNGKLEIRHGWMLFVMAFPLVENLIMKEHAISYTYDRMKGIFVLSFLICELSSILLESAANKLSVLAGILAVTTCVCGLNLKAYMNNTDYIWSIDYRDYNQMLADYLNDYYTDSVLSTESNGVRGYVTLLFGRGIFEGTGVEETRRIAAERGKRYAIMINFEDGRELYNSNWNLCRITSANVYDIQTDEESRIDMKLITGDECLVDSYQLADLTDVNWTAGYSRQGNTLLFNRDDALLIELLTRQCLVADDEIYYINDVDFDDNWIRVLVDRNAERCMYPAMIRVE